jgi:TPR repeat protein
LLRETVGRAGWTVLQRSANVKHNSHPVRSGVDLVRLVLPALVALLAVLSPGDVLAGPLEDAAAAYVRKDYATALSVWRPLAALGNAAAQFNLGLMYDNGQGVEQDYPEAVKWYSLAAAQGDAQAQYNLGYMYDNGQGTLRNYAEAVKWYRLAAVQGDARAQSSLGMMYANGQGVERDFSRSYMWFSLAVIAGNSPSAAVNRDVVARQLTPQQLGEAEERAIACMARRFKGCD